MMEAEVQKKPKNFFYRNIAAIGIITFILLMLAIAGQFTYTVLSYENVYKGVTVNGSDVSGLSGNELYSLLEKQFCRKSSSTEIMIKSGNASEKFNFSSIHVRYNIEEAMNAAFEVGRKGNVFQRLWDIVAASRDGRNITVSCTFDSEKLQKYIRSLYNKTLIDVKQPDLYIGSDKVILHSGSSGQAIDMNKLFTEIKASIDNCESKTFDVQPVITKPKKIDLNELYEKIHQDAIDAKINVDNNIVSVIPHVVGREINKSSLEAIVSELEKSENNETVLPVVFVQPKITTDIASANLFRDNLGSMNTQFYTANQNDSNRGVNIRIAVSRINGTVIASGEVFSFNEIVGPRTEAEGYKVAHTYVGGKIVDGIGGGICQVSSTLYNAVLFSDLVIKERTNHMFTVGYVPLGRDAAVSYNDVDFKFVNNTNWPIKIEGWVTSGNQINFVIKGTNETPGKTIVLSAPQIIKTVQPPPVKYVDDPALPAGTEKVDHEAMTGYVVDTFKITKIDGKVVKEEKLHRSIYKALGKEIRRGTKKASAPAPQPSKPPVGVDEAANPPAKPAQ
ncbi:MAG: VanW family protein [Clostridia bacterium]|nr:VanW family protein [Clostridia bacterium]